MAEAGGVTFAEVTFTPPGGSSPILDGISLQLDAGSTTALLGRSGSGKTTLLRTVNGLVLPTSGSVTVDGKRIDASISPASLRTLRHGIGYVIQETGLFPHMKIGQNVALPLELAGVSEADRTQRAKELLRTVDLDPESFAMRYPHELSGGQRQRVGLARALVNDPAVLLLDEPFGALDPLTRSEMQSMLRDLLSGLNKTTLIVTHDLQEAIFLAQRVLFVDAGHIVADLPGSEVLQSELPAVIEYVRAANRFEPAA